MTAIDASRIENIVHTCPKCHMPCNCHAIYPIARRKPEDVFKCYHCGIKAGWPALPPEDKDHPGEIAGVTSVEEENRKMRLAIQSAIEAMRGVMKSLERLR